MRRRVWRAIAVAALLFVYASFLAGPFLAEISLHPPRRLVDRAAQQTAHHTAQAYSATLSEVTLRAKDGVLLRAWFFRPDKPNGNSVLLLHGVADSRAGMLAYARLFLRKGYSVLAPDARAHGDSDGDIATYGLREAGDIQQWATSLVETEPTNCVYALAESMGAGQLLQSLAAEPRFCAVVAESPFATFREVAYDRVGRPFGAGPWLGRTLLRIPIESALLYARLRYGIDLTRANPTEAIRNTRMPILLIHGKDDSNIPPRHSERLHASNPSATSLWLVTGAQHTGALGTAPAEFEQRVTAWFAKYNTR
ncbi:MAG: alpha/beta fold hydrolase [Acidobacteria bacterium]|nr:alpha/beta fold hydrolase [Acidobacteriota bacterium]